MNEVQLRAEPFFVQNGNIFLIKSWNFHNFYLFLPLITDNFKADAQNNHHNNCSNGNVGILLQE